MSYEKKRASGAPLPNIPPTQIREHVGLSYEQIAEKLGCKKTHISQIMQHDQSCETTLERFIRSHILLYYRE